MASTPLKTLVIRCYPGQAGDNNTYTLYEDDGLTTDYLQERFATTALTYKKTVDGMVLIRIAPTQGNYEGQPLKRAYRIELPGMSSAAQIRVNGKKLKIKRSENVGGLVIPIAETDNCKRSGLNRMTTYFSIKRGGFYNCKGLPSLWKSIIKQTKCHFTTYPRLLMTCHSDKNRGIKYRGGKAVSPFPVIP